MRLNTALRRAAHACGATYEQMLALSGRFQACGPDSLEDRGMFHSGHVGMLVWWWTEHQRRNAR
jgi:hypothetical protein